MQIEKSTQTSTVTHGTITFTKFTNGIVSVVGSLSTPTSYTAYDNAVPSGFRPSDTTPVPGVDAGGNFRIGYINSDGKFNVANGANAYFAFNAFYYVG